jgi:hypothetical protein
VIPHLDEDTMANERFNNRSEIQVARQQSRGFHVPIESVGQHVGRQQNIYFLLAASFAGDGS